MVTIKIQREFDPALWESAPFPAKPASTLLVTWTVDPEPVDGGMPPEIQMLFARALCSLGTVFYAADAEAQKTAALVAEFPVRRGLRRQSLLLFRAAAEREVLPAFESGLHDWSSNAQWLIVAGPSGLENRVLEPLARTLYQDWHLPAPWPDGVLLIVQAGVDGDAAICHCKDEEVDRQFCRALDAETAK